MKFYFKEGLSLISLDWGEHPKKYRCLDLGIKYIDWRWGYSKFWYDGEYHLFGLGPIFLFTWTN